MGLNVGFLYLVICGTILGIHARELETFNFIIPAVEKSEDPDLQINHEEPKREIRGSVDEKNDKKVCKLCEEFAMEAQYYLAENRTRTEIMSSLYKYCSALPYKEQCVKLVDNYASIVFLELSSVQPRDFCKKMKLCEASVFRSRHLNMNICGLCHYAVTEVILMLKSPDTQLEVVELLLKTCDAAMGYEEQCKKFVFDYIPVVFEDAQEFLQGNDLCISLQVCSNNPITKLFTLFSSLL
jgi:saposin